MDTANLERVEILKGPASLVVRHRRHGWRGQLCDQGAAHRADRQRSLRGFQFVQRLSRRIWFRRQHTVDGLDYRFDITHSNNVGFIDDTYSKLSNVSGQLNYRVTDNFKIWGAAEYKQDKDRFYWGTPLVPANAPGIVPTNGIVSGLWSNYYLNGHTRSIEPGTIDARTLRRTTMCSITTAARRSCGFAVASSGTLPTTYRSEARSTVTTRIAIGSTTKSVRLTDSGSNNVYRERLALDHAQRLYGNVTDLTINSNIGGMENRFVTTVAASSQQFNVSQDTLFFSDTVNLINPDRGLYGPRSERNLYPPRQGFALV